MILPIVLKVSNLFIIFTQSFTGKATIALFKNIQL